MGLHVGQGFIRFCACTLPFNRNVGMQVSSFTDMGRVHRDSGVASLLGAADSPLGGRCPIALVAGHQDYI